MTITITPTPMIRTPTDIHTTTVGDGIIPMAIRSMVEGLVLAADIMDTASMAAAFMEVAVGSMVVGADFTAAVAVIDNERHSPRLIQKLS